MSIPASCPKCQAKYRVKEELQGKRFVCKKCQSPVLVRAPAVEVGGPDLSRLFDDEDAAPQRDPAQETSTDLEMFADTTEEMVLKRTSSFDLEESSARRQPAGSFSARMSHAPLSIPAFAFFLVWLPLSCLEVHFAWVVNIILGGIFLTGAAVVKVLEVMEIPIDNPLALFNQFVWSGFQSPPASSSGVLKRKKSAGNGYDLTIQLLIMFGFLFVHTAVLSLKWYAPW